MTTNTNEAKRPTHIIWQVFGEGEKARWTRVGSGWSNRDNKGITLKFDAYPVTGRTVIREFTDAKEGGQK